MKRYTILLTKEDDAYLVDVPALPGCHTWGATRDEALRNAQEAVELYLEELRATGEPIPEDVAPQVASVEVAA